MDDGGRHTTSSYMTVQRHSILRIESGLFVCMPYPRTDVHRTRSSSVACSMQTRRRCLARRSPTRSTMVTTLHHHHCDACRSSDDLRILSLPSCNDTHLSFETVEDRGEYLCAKRTTHKPRSSLRCRPLFLVAFRLLPVSASPT